MNKELEKLFYGDDESFKPLLSNHGITDGELAHYRNTFMSAEKEYFLELLKDDELREEFILLINEDDDFLLREATKLQDKLENGELESREELELMKTMTSEEREKYHMRKLEIAEGKICLLYGAVRDKALIKALIKSYNIDESMERSIKR